MWRQRRLAVGRDDGFSLAETLVAIALFAVVTSLVAGAVIDANQVTRRSTSSVWTQSQVLTAVSRISREVEIAAPLLTAAPNTVETQTVRAGTCYVNRFTLSGNTLDDQQWQIPGVSTCPTQITGTPHTTVLVGGVTNGATPLFTYYDVHNTVLPVPVANLAAIVRVGINVRAAVVDRPSGVHLVTSAALRQAAVSDNGVQPVTPPGAPVLSGTMNGNTGVLTWTQPAGATGYVLTRGGSPIAQVPDPTTTSYQDPNLSPGGTYTYQVFATDGGGNSIGSNTVTLHPVVCTLPYGTTAVSYTPLLTDGSSTGPTLKDICRSGGIGLTYGQSTTTTPVYGWKQVRVPVYGWIPQYGWKPVYGWVGISPRSVFYNGQKCYWKGSDPLPQPYCVYDPRMYYPGASSIYSWVYAGNSPYYVNDYGNTTPGTGYLADGHCDSYVTLAPGGVYQWIQGWHYVWPPLNGRWWGPDGYGWYYACMWNSSYRWQVVRYVWGITGYKWGVTGYLNQWVWGITGYQTTVSRTYQLTWVGTGPCPTVTMPVTKTDTSGVPPGTLTLSYDASTGEATLSGSTYPGGTILTAAIPQTCVY